MIDYDSLRSIRVNSIKESFCGFEYNCTFTFNDLSEKVGLFKAIIIPEEKIMGTSFFSDNYSTLETVAEDLRNYSSNCFCCKLQIQNNRFEMNSSYHNFVDFEKGC